MILHLRISLYLLLGIGLFGCSKYSETEIIGISMSPTIDVGDNLSINKYAYKKKEIKRWDIIAFYHPDHPDHLTTMRVIGLPGESIIIKPDGIYINKTKLNTDLYFKFIYREQPYMEYSINTEYIIPKDCVYVVGDNIKISLDSRSFGGLPKDKVIGQVAFIYKKDGRTLDVQ